MKYKLVIFDFDGTLADTFPWLMRMLDGITEKYRLRRVTAHEFEQLRGYSARQALRYVGVPMWKLPLIANHLRHLVSRDIDQIALFEGVEPLLRRLADAGVTLAIVSSNSEQNIRRALGAECAALISCYECGAGLFGKTKKFQKVLRRCGVAAGQAICIGDELRDGEAARAAQIDFGAVTWGYSSAEALRAQVPTLLFNRVDEIIERVV